MSTIALWRCRHTETQPWVVHRGNNTKSWESGWQSVKVIGQGFPGKLCTGGPSGFLSQKVQLPTRHRNIRGGVQGRETVSCDPWKGIQEFPGFHW